MEELLKLVGIGTLMVVSGFVTVSIYMMAWGNWYAPLVLHNYNCWCITVQLFNSWSKKTTEGAPRVVTRKLSCLDAKKKECLNAS